MVVGLLVFAIALVADLAVKNAAWSHFVEGERWVDQRVVLYPQPMPSVVAIPNALNLTAVANQGAAMGLGQGRRGLFLGVGLVACLAVGAFFAHSLKHGGGGTRGKLARVTFSLLLAGIVGNLYDRISLGYVRDMFHMVPGLRWSDVLGALPAKEVFPWVYNLADVYLCVGVGAVLLLSLLEPKPTKTKSDA